jgi:hypothetical protein
MVPTLNREAQVVNGKNTLMGKASHTGWISRLAGAAVFVQLRRRLKKTIRELER